MPVSVQTTNTLGDLARDIWADVESQSASMVGIEAEYDWMFKYFKSKQLYELFRDFNGFPASGRFNDGQYPQSVSYTPQYSLQITPSLYGLMFNVTRQADFVDVNGVFRRVAQQLTDSQKQARAVDATLVLGNAFDAAYPIADGLAFASAVHTTRGGTGYSNLLTATLLSNNSLILLSNVLATQSDGQGKPMRNTKSTRLVTGRTQESTARTILESKNIAGSINNDKQIVSNFRGNMELIINSNLDTSSTTSFFLFSSDTDKLGLRWVEQIPTESHVTSGKAGEQTFLIQGSWARGVVHAYNTACCAGAS